MESIENKEDRIETSKESKRKSFKNKLVTAALGVSLMTGGCSAGDTPRNEKKSEPVQPDSVEEIVDFEDQDFNNEQEVIVETENVFESLVESNDAYEINLDPRVKEYIDSIREKEGEILKYPVLDSKEHQDHFEKSQNFAWNILGQEVEGEHPLYLAQGYTEWRGSEGVVSYSSSPAHLLRMEFETPVEVPDVQMDPENKESIEEALGKITGGLEHRVEEIVEEGEYYRISLSRTINESPIYQLEYPLYLLVSKDGKLKGGELWLKEFEAKGEATILSSDEFSQNINSEGYPKSISFTVPDLPTTYMHDNFYPHHSADVYLGDGVANLDKVELVYYYKFFEEGVVLPMFRLEGEGIKNPEKHVNEEEKKAEFEVLANAMSFEHVEGYPKK